ncbi:MAG: roadblock/LC7 domain-containing protein [Methanomicrobiaceae archaeon]|nr:roadblock/LC7 domain-containing protein [Methanomicrobiaceae archaeon]
MNPALPQGERIATMQIPLERLFDLAPGFTGCVKAEMPEGGGFLLVEDGKPVAGGFISGALKLTGKEAYQAMLKDGAVNCVLDKYTPDELETAKEKLMSDFSITENEKSYDILSHETLQNLMRQPGVLAVSIFFEGFAIHSAGEADFEHVAAVAEDLVRAGARITDDLMMGGLSQLLLETPRGKLIIAPVKELFICVLAETDANIGLIRLALQAIKYNMEERSRD